MIDNKRFQMWAGIQNGEWPNAIWPIVDSETCGPIHGFPSVNQFFCVAFDSTAQRIIYEALNKSATTAGYP